MKRRLSFVLPILALATLAAAGVFWRQGLLAAASQDNPSAGTSTNTVGGPFSLTDQFGKRRTDQDFRGKYMLVFFGYTFCPDVCPTTLAVEAEALDKMGVGAGLVAPIFISVDPKRDTPEKLKAYLAAFDPQSPSSRPNFVGLTGTAEETAAVIKAYDVYYRLHPDPHTERGAYYSIDHSTNVYLMNKQGKFLAYYSAGIPPDVMAADLLAKTSSRKPEARAGGAAAMIGFDEILSPLGADNFLREYWLKQFVHIEGMPGRFQSLLTWDDLNGILEQHRLAPPRLALYQDGRAVDLARFLTPARFGVPRLDAGGLAVCLAQGASLILDDAQELAPKVQDLMHVFQEALHTDAYANLYAGWRSQKAFDRHWDAQEAIVLQLCGKKRWKVYEPTRLHPLKNDVEQPVPPTAEPVWDGVLSDGDVLYIPRGWWHVAFPLDEPSLHLTVSITPPTGMDYLGWIMAQLRENAEARGSLPLSVADAARVVKKLSGTLSSLTTKESVSAFFEEWEANIRPTPHIRLPDVPYEQFSPVSEESRVRLAALSRLSFSPQGETLVFIAAGRRWTVPKSLRAALGKLQNSRAIAVRELIASLSSPSATTDLLKSLHVLAQGGVILTEKD